MLVMTPLLLPFRRTTLRNLVLHFANVKNVAVEVLLHLHSSWTIPGKTYIGSFLILCRNICIFQKSNKNNEKEGEFAGVIHLVIRDNVVVPNHGSWDQNMHGKLTGLVSISLTSS